MPPEDNKKAVQRMLEAFNTGDLTIVDQLLGPEFSDQTPFPGTDRKENGLKKQIHHLRQAFPDVQFSIDHIVAEGDIVAFRWKMTGTQRGTLMGYAPSNKTVTHYGNDFVTFKNGKMIDHRSSDNLRDLLQSLGHPPTPQPEKDPDLRKPLR